MKKQLELSVVIPAFNEEDEITETLKTITSFLQRKKISHEIIIVDDGSKDKTKENIRKLQKKIPTIRLLMNKKNLGKGEAVKKGVLAASGNFILFCDVDLSAPINQYILFKKYLLQGYEVVFGSRYLKQSNVIIAQPFHRRHLGKVFYFLVRRLIISGVYDTNCGFKAYTNKAAKKIFRKQVLSGWGFDTELLLIAKRMNFKIKEVPIKWKDSSYSKVKIIPAVTKTLHELVKLKLNDLRGFYS